MHLIILTKLTSFHIGSSQNTFKEYSVEGFPGFLACLIAHSKKIRFFLGNKIIPVENEN